MIDRTKVKLVEQEIKAHVSIPYMFNNILGFYGNIAGESVCCPFHGERTPSFSYSEALQIWTCFGQCSKSGDVIELYRFYLEKFKGLKVTRTRTIEMLMSIPYIQGFVSVDSLEVKRTNVDFRTYLDMARKNKEHKIDKKIETKVKIVSKVLNSKTDEEFIENYNSLLWSNTNIYESED